MNESDTKKLEAKKKEWARKDSLERAIMKAKREIKYNVTNWLDWYFGDADQKDGVDKILRRFGILAIDLIILRALHFI